MKVGQQNPVNIEYIDQWGDKEPYPNRNFVDHKYVLRYTDKHTNEQYSKIYDYIQRKTMYNIKQFKFGIVVYDETEHFPKDIRNSRFNYPYVNQKHVTHQFGIHDLEGEVETQRLFLQKSTVCLEPSPFAGLDIPKMMKQAFYSSFGKYDEVEDEKSTDPCSKPDYKKVKLGGYDLKHSKAEEDMMQDFLEIQMH